MNKGHLWVVTTVLFGIVGTAEAQIVLPGLVHRWSANGHALDLVGDSDGELVGDVGYGPGHFSQAFAFTGGHIDFGTVAGNFKESAFTMSLWVQTDDMTGRVALIEKRPECGNAVSWFDLRVFDREPQAELSRPIQRVRGGLVAGESWHHVVVRREGVMLTLFVDGEPVDVDEGAEVVDLFNDSHLILGGSICEGIDGTRPLSGGVDEIQFYDRALTQEEIEILADDPGCIADLNDNGEVEFADLLILLGFWGECDCPADLDLNGIVDFSDLLFLLSVWGPCE